MNAITIVLGASILACAFFLIIAVLLQSSKNHRMSGVISGGADTFFGKQKGKTMDAILSKVTAVISVVFCVLVLGLYIYTARTAAPAPQDITVDPSILNSEVAEDPIITDEIEVVEDEAAAPESETEAPVTEETPEAEAEQTPAEGEATTDAEAVTTPHEAETPVAETAEATPAE